MSDPMNDPHYQRGLRDGKIQTEAYEHFDVLHNGSVPQEDLHSWVKESYDAEAAERLFPIEPPDEPYPGTVAALEKRVDGLEARLRKLEG